MKTIILPYDELCIDAAERIVSLIRQKQNACLALSAGEEQEGVYEALVMLCKGRGVSMSGCSIFLTNEYEGIPPDREQSCLYRLRGLLFGSGADGDKIFCPGAENTDSFDELIALKGGLDMALLGLGDNCRIAFNEPGTAYASLSHRQKLTDATKREKAELFGSFEAVPDYGYTMGINTIISARQQILVAAGEEKAEAVFNTLYARNDSYRPSAFLQIPAQVSLYADPDAAAKL